MAEVYVIGGYGFSDNVLHHGQRHGSLKAPFRLRLTSCMSIEQSRCEILDAEVYT